MQFCIFLYHQNQKIRKKRDFSFNNFSTTKLITMVEVEEIELDLGLSIGGSFRKPVEKPKPVFGSDGGVSDSDPRDGMQRVDSQSQLQVKREVQALRRMEAKRKREQKKGPTIDPVGDSEPECQRLKTGFIDGVTNVSWTAPFRLQPQQYATVQYVPLNNGLPLPCWFASEKNGGGLEGFNGGDGKVKSNGSSRCSSSAVSDYQSSSREDGGSTDSHSHSANSFAEPIQLNIKSQPELSSSFHHPIRSHQCNNNIQYNRNHNNVIKETQTQTQSNIMQLQTNPMKLKEEAKGTRATNNKAIPMSKLVTQMPYVSAKGNGPNGKTVNGFLYRYSKSEVSIVCVCHGSTFSAAEFVEHAGGTDISHPLRHITVIPYAFG